MHALHSRIADEPHVHFCKDYCVQCIDDVFKSTISFNSDYCLHYELYPKVPLPIKQPIYRGRAIVLLSMYLDVQEKNVVCLRCMQLCHPKGCLKVIKCT